MGARAYITSSYPGRRQRYVERNVNSFVPAGPGWNRADIFIYADRLSPAFSGYLHQAMYDKHG